MNSCLGKRGTAGLFGMQLVNIVELENYMANALRTSPLRKRIGIRKRISS